MNFKMESLIGEFPNIGKFPTLCSPDNSGKNSPALRTNLEIFQGEPLHGEFVENVWRNGYFRRRKKIQSKLFCVITLSFFQENLTNFSYIDMLTFAKNGLLKI